MTKYLNFKSKLTLIPAFVLAVSAVALIAFIAPTPDKAQAFILGDCSTIPSSVPNPMIAGQVYQVTISCTNQFGVYSQAAGVRMVSVNGANTPTGNIWGLTQVTMTGPENLNKADNVQPGQTKLFQFNVTAPASAGTHLFRWKLYEGATPTNNGNGETNNYNITVNVPSGVMSIAPNPCVIASGQPNCTSPLTWTTTNFPTGQYSMVKLSINGAAEFRYSCGGANGTSNSTATVASGASHVYRLYRAATWQNCLDGVQTGGVLATVNFSGVQTPSCAAPSPVSGGWVTATSGNRATTVSGVSGATQVLFATWTNAGGQDDIVWYSGTNNGSGNWGTNINLASHTGIGLINVHVIARNAVGDTFCGTSNFYRLATGTVNITSNIPTTYTINCNLTNPACPSTFVGTPTTTGSHTGRPFATWTLTPATINGYTYTVTPSVTQVLQ